MPKLIEKWAWILVWWVVVALQCSASFVLKVVLTGHSLSFGQCVWVAQCMSWCGLC